MSSRRSSASDAPSRRAGFLERLAGSGPFGFGASSLGNLYHAMDDAQAQAAVDAAWEAGVRHFDTAPFYGYGLSERRLGAALARRPRAEAILSTKVGRLLVPDAAAGEADGFRRALPYRPVFDYSHDGVLRSFEASLTRLGTDRVDLLLMHDIGRATHGADHDRHWRDAVTGGFPAMQRLRDEGAVTAIGLGVNEVAVCSDALDRVDLDVLLVANRYTLLDRSAGDLFDRCRREGVGVVAAGVFSSGILASGSGSGSGAHFDYAPAPPAVVDRVRRMEAVCNAFGVPLPAVAHRFVRRHPGVTQTLLGLRDTAELAAAIDHLAVAIPDPLWPALT